MKILDEDWGAFDYLNRWPVRVVNTDNPTVQEVIAKAEAEIAMAKEWFKRERKARLKAERRLREATSNG